MVKKIPLASPKEGTLVAKDCDKQKNETFLSGSEGHDMLDKCIGAHPGRSGLQVIRNRVRTYSRILI